MRRKKAAAFNFLKAAQILSTRPMRYFPVQTDQKKPNWAATRPIWQHWESVSLNPSFPWALAAVIGQMAQCFVIGLPRTARMTAHGRPLCKCVTSWLTAVTE